MENLDLDFEYNVAPKVRGFTDEERKLTVPGDNETPEQKMQRRVDTAAINIARYEDAASTHPEMSEHFARQIIVAGMSLNAWQKRYDEINGAVS